LQGVAEDHCTDYNVVSNSIAGGRRVPRLDQYQGDWTFDYAVPPNPLVVDSSAPLSWAVSDSVGDDWSCGNGDRSSGQIVTNHGTCKFPYKTVTAAVNRAQGSVPEDPYPNAARAGYGWTLLLRPGNYAEGLSINIPLTLKKDSQFAGAVVIGK
jgi:hypothetical protein